MEETEIIMDYEKKDFRKLYEDLVKSEWFKKAYHDKSLGDCPFNIPELAESEDERMCTRCIELLRKVSAYSGEEYLGVEIADCIIWLQALRKKQKESLHIPQTCKENPDSFTDEDEKVRKEILAFVIDMDCKESWIHYLEKQKEHQNNSDAPNESSWSGIISSSHKDKNLDEIAQDYVDGVKEYNLEPTWDLMQTAVCYGYHYCEQKEQKPEEKPINWTELTWKDIVELEGIINNVHYDFSAGIGKESFGKEVLERFRSTKGVEYLDESEQKYWQKEKKPVEGITQDKIERGMKKLTDFKVFAAKEAKQYNISHRRDIDWHNFCASLLTYLEVNKPVEWSEEDEKMIRSILFVLESYVSKAECEQSPALTATYPTYYKEIDWLKSLRPQKLDASKLENFDPVDVLNRIKTEWPMAWEKVVGKQEWSEEDEKMRQGCIDSVEYELLDNGMDDEVKTDPRIVWLKSLRPSWKPSNEQMGALYDSIEWEGERAEDVDFILKSLYNDLKKLM